MCSGGVLCKPPTPTYKASVDGDDSCDGALRGMKLSSMRHTRHTRWGSPAYGVSHKPSSSACHLGFSFYFFTCSVNSFS